MNLDTINMNSFFLKYIYMFRLFPLVGFVSNISKENGSHVTIEKNIAKSFQESVNERIMDDIPKVLGSFLIMFIYVSLSLGRLNFVENRVIFIFIQIFLLIEIKKILANNKKSTKCLNLRCTCHGVVSFL